MSASTDDTTLREAEIRPPDLIAAAAAAYEDDRAMLLAESKHFVVVDCPACGGRDRKREFDKGGFTYVSCTACNTAYISPRPTLEQLVAFHAHSKSYAMWNATVFPASEEARRSKIFRPRAERLDELCRRHGVAGTVLEVGAAFGTFCQELTARGHFRRVIAVEPSHDLAERCRGRGLEVIESAIETADLRDISVDVIASFEVIEHLFDPRGFLEACARVLRPGGLLVLTCPSVAGFDVEMLRDKSDTYDFAHLNYFGPASLARLVTSMGLEVVEVSTPGKLDAEIVRKKALAGEIALADPFLRRVLIDEWDSLGTKFQSFLADNGLSSHLWLAARKGGASS